jgi:hypothetical protein
MSKIRYPQGPGTPYVSRPAAPAPRPAPARRRRQRQPDPEETDEESPWETAVIRVSTMVAVWLGY